MPPVPRWTSGTEFAKALVFEIDEDGTAIVRGVGRKRQGLTHMQSGTVADITAVVDNCQVALQEAEEMAGFRSRQVIIGIAGELVKGFTTSVSQERKKPDQQLTARELDSLIETVQKEALREAERTVTWETGLPNVDIRLVHAAVTGASIDGYTVTNPVGFHGRHVRISVFNAFAPLIHLGALQTVASMLDLELVAIVAEPYAVARCMDDDQVHQAGRAVRRRWWRHDGRGSGSPGWHRGHAHVRPGWPRIHQISCRSAGSAVRSSGGDRRSTFAKGVDVERKKEIGEIIGEDVAVWQAGVELVLEEFAKSGMLPGPDLPVRGRRPLAADRCRVA